MTKDEALKLALEALEWCHGGEPCGTAEAITAIEEALAQPEQEPLFKKIIDQHPGLAEELKALDEQELVDWRNAAIRVGEDLSSVGPDGYYDMTAQEWLDWAIEQEPRGKNSLAQPEQEPVACIGTSGELMWLNKPMVIYSKPQPLYTAPPQRKPLTDEEIEKLADDFLAYQIEDYQVSGVFTFARAIEAAHGIKENT